MNPLFIFLFFIIFACVFFGSKPMIKESFKNVCNTLRCKKSKYSITSFKNRTMNNVSNIATNHMETMQNHFTNLKDQWL